MNRYNPKIHHRRSIRLKGYDYAQAGLYFITICINKRLHLFGHITDGIMHLNDAGLMVQRWYIELENKFPDIKIHEMIIMPNHFHCIVENVGPVGAAVGADLRVRPPAGSADPDDGQSHGIAPTILGEHMGSPLHRVLQWFKTMTTNEYIRNVKSDGWERFDGKLWQRNYWEHIIRNEKSYDNISRYIINNPMKWQMDKLNNGDNGDNDGNDNRVSEPEAIYNDKIWMV